MSGKNTWFLITSEEIERIRNGLEECRKESPGDSPCPVQEILALIDNVQDRLA
jgi:hypothetical protein